MPANLQTISAHLLPEPLQAARHTLSGRIADVAHSPSRGSAQRSPPMISQKKQGEGLQENRRGGRRCIFHLLLFSKVGDYRLE